MLRRFFKYSSLIVITIALVNFSVVNRAIITISLFPFPYESDVPVFLFAIMCVAAGVIFASIGCFSKIHGLKRTLSSERRKIAGLENQLQSMQKEMDQRLAAISKPVVSLS